MVSLHPVRAIAARGTPTRPALIAAVAAAAMAAAALVWLFVRRPPALGEVSAIAALIAGVLYLASHGARAVRLALLTAPALAASARTVILMHLATAPVAALVPLKLGELLRLQQLYAIGRRLLAAIMLLLVERVLDAAALLAIFAVLAAAGRALGGAATGLLAVSAGIVAVAAGAFVLGPSALAGVQRHMLVHHHRPRARRVLRTIDLLRRATDIGAGELRRQGGRLAVITAAIWALEFAAMAALTSAAFGQGALDAAALLVGRAMQEWLAIFGLIDDPAILAASFVSLAALLLIWPAAAFLYVGRRAMEEAYAQPRRSAAAVRPPHAVAVVIDDRTAVPREIEMVIGKGRYSQILRRRRRLIDEIRDAAAPGAAEIVVVQDDAEAREMARRISEWSDERFVLRLPTCIAPTDLDALGLLVEKSRYAIETMIVGEIVEDEAPMLLTPRDAAALLRAPDAEGRLAVIHRLSDAAPRMIDHAGMVDLRRTRPLLSFLAGSTEARSFNATAADSGVFRKSSTDVAKMRREHRFFHVAPDPMKRFLPPTFDYWERDDRAGYAMEHVAVPDVALQAAHDAFSPAEFDLLLDQFFAFLATRAEGAADRAAVERAGRIQILDKMTERLDQLAATEEGRRLDAVLTAAGPMGGLAAMRERSTRLIEAGLARDRSDRLVFGHGDPCFSNILFDRRTGMMRLVDPRGADSFEDGLAHPLYDLAKFSHSALGGYDFINSELFLCAIDRNQTLSLRLDRGGPPAWMDEAFSDRLGAAGWDRFAVRAVELSLFMSMLPLHRDHERKLTGFVCVACRIIEELEREP